ncbi:MAG: DUF4492 domain-containing protein [Candidatus Electrothrix sp. GW3-4]|uniref:DUF4492 domain-containing protein n=1 Tax=Candidatus Electrothrix sp. GW3-4 TaxID=3126740 RepID=UPI0030D28A66
MKEHQSVFQEAYRFYRDGFRNMTVGKTLWKIICIKLIIMFAVLKLFFFEDFLGTRFTTDEERADYVLSELISSKQANSLFLHDKENKND